VADLTPAPHDIFAELAGKDEGVLRRILRSHRDGQFRGDEKYDSDDMKLRKRLDQALEGLMVHEVLLETSVETATPELTHALKTLFASSSFARYINSYLYFGIRFMAARLLGERSYAVGPVRRRGPGTDDDLDSSRSHPKRSFDINDVPFPLPEPPSLSPNDLVMDGINKRRALMRDEEVIEALAFLDDCVPSSQREKNDQTIQEISVVQGADCGWQVDYERWLRGLGHDPDRAPYFRTVTDGLRRFIFDRVAVYSNLEGPAKIERWRVCGRLTDVMAHMPHTARIGLLDLYWLARLLRAEVSSVGVVTYNGDSLLTLLAERARIDNKTPSEIQAIEEAKPVLRAVFDFTCDLIQNSVAIACDRLDHAMRPETFPTLPDETVTWRGAYDEELAEVAEQRRMRGFVRYADFNGAAIRQRVRSKAPRVDWSHRVRTGEHPEHLIGLAFSGGGIRSATFNLGVLQRLQELDLLRSVDYLSTVSGGGYIGGWLLGNVRRTNYWLSQLTDWAPSIEHLRRFSNYLAPRVGLMSVDTWAMWASWIRNAFLIQLTSLAWLWALLVITRINESIFTWHRFASIGVWPGNLILALPIVLLTGSICRSIRSERREGRPVITELSVVWQAVIPVWVGSFLVAAMLWATHSADDATYSHVLSVAWDDWLGPLVVMFVCLAVLAACSIDMRRKPVIRYFVGLLTAGGAIGVLYLGFCGVRWMFGQLDASGGDWIAYVVGPPAVLLAATLSIVIIIGIIGNDSEDWRREWWTRFGSWVGILGVGFMVLSVTSVFGPLLTLTAFDHSWSTVQWSTVLGWIATVIGGLMSGNSERTSGGGGRSLSSTALEWLSKIAAVAFIAGAVLIGATLLHVLLIKVFTDYDILARIYWVHMDAISTADYWWSFLGLVVLGVLFSLRFDINIFGLNQFYRNRLVRCYLGATRWRWGLRRPHPFTGFDGDDDIELYRFSNLPEHEQPYRGPFPILNGSLNLGGSSDLGVHTRHSASFVFTPLRAGADRKAVGYSPMYGDPSDRNRNAFNGGVKLGQAISVSGAAASPNMGYSTSPLVAVLLTLFNVRLAWWFPNPGKSSWHLSRLRLSTWYLVKEMFGLADEKNRFINVSDGGHFENLGIYELVRRRCKVIVACDAECDPELSFGSLGNVIRLCEVDFDAKIKIDVESIRRQKDTPHSRAHCAIGRISYSNGSRGYLIYLKSSLTGDEDADIEQYHANHLKFPHESTGDQFFAEDQFESYRRLGHHVTKMAFRDVEHEPTLLEMARNLADLWAPASDGTEFVGQAEELNELWERFRTTPTLQALLDELMSDRFTDRPPGAGPVSGERLAVCLQLIQLMENVFIALQLDDFWTHPDNRGWVELFTRWAKSGTFRDAWEQTSETFGVGFVYFCEHRLGLVARSQRHGGGPPRLAPGPGGPGPAGPGPAQINAP
jgi:hypothetical protein